MAWMRTREIKPGVYETQSAGFHATKQVAIAAAVLIATIALLMALFSGNLQTLVWIGIAVFLLVGWHWSHYQDHRGDRPARTPGPWDGADRTPTLAEVLAENERLRAEANRKH